MKFTTAIKMNWLVQKVPWTDFWRVWEMFKWQLVYWDNSQVIYVHKWFITNFWSIPPLFRIFFNPTKYLAYILHDKMYSKEYKSKLTREDKDKILFESLWVEWAWLVTRLFIYMWVRIFWGLYYKK